VRVAHLNAVMREHVDRGALPGLVTAISRRGETHLNALGTTAAGGSTLGFSIVTGPDATPALPGRRGWDGGLGTSCYWDPREGCVGVLLTQLAVTSADAQAIRQDFWTSVYGAFDD
jgi:CubicO group peptidase (beta-lactamase class C family)